MTDVTSLVPRFHAIKVMNNLKGSNHSFSRIMMIFRNGFKVHTAKTCDDWSVRREEIGSAMIERFTTSKNKRPQQCNKPIAGSWNLAVFSCCEGERPEARPHHSRTLEPRVKNLHHHTGIKRNEFGQMILELNWNEVNSGKFVLTLLSRQSSCYWKC